MSYYLFINKKATPQTESEEMKMTVVDMVIGTMRKGEYATHYKKGNSNFFLRNNENFYYLDKVTKGCSATVVAGTEEEVLDYIKENKLKQVALLHI